MTAILLGLGSFVAAWLTKKLLDLYIKKRWGSDEDIFDRLNSWRKLRALETEKRMFRKLLSMRKQPEYAQAEFARMTMSFQFHSFAALFSFVAAFFVIENLIRIANASPPFHESSIFGSYAKIHLVITASIMLVVMFLACLMSQQIHLRFTRLNSRFRNFHDYVNNLKKKWPEEDWTIPKNVKEFD